MKFCVVPLQFFKIAIGEDVMAASIFLFHEADSSHVDPAEDRRLVDRKLLRNLLQTVCGRLNHLKRSLFIGLLMNKPKSPDTVPHTPTGINIRV